MAKKSSKKPKPKKNTKYKGAHIVGAATIIAAIIGVFQFRVICNNEPASVVVKHDPASVDVVDTVKTEKPKLHSFKGYVFDCFNYPVAGVEVKIVQSGGAIIRNFKTDNRGEYIVKDIVKNETYKFRIDYLSSSVERNIDFNKIDTNYNTYRDTLVLNPISRITITLCKDIEFKEPIESYIKENPNIRLDDLPVIDTLRNLKEIYCHLRIFGEHNYQAGKDIKILYKWYFKDELQKLVSPQEVGISESGWRTFRSHPVWKGEWVIKITTIRGFELGRQNFNILK